MLRLLSAIADDRTLSAHLRFKGGTCAAMRDLLDRFSVDLDFDLSAMEHVPMARNRFERIFRKLHLTIKDQSEVIPQYFLRYDAGAGRRNTLALDITVPPPQSNEYEIIRFTDIDRFLPCQTVATMVGNKLVTPLDRYEKHKTIAGRDIYDIHHFLFKGMPWNTAVIEERSHMNIPQFVRTLREFIDAHVTQTVLDQDLNLLLPAAQFRQIRRVLKQETLTLLQQHG